MEASQSETFTALEQSQKCLRRLVRIVKDMELSDELELELKRSRRQMRENREILGEVPAEAAKS